MLAQNSTKPMIAALTDRECHDVLSRNHIGRLAFVNTGRMDIEPVSYVAAAPWIFIRSAQGAKVDALSHTPYVAFEVDEVKSVFGWQSVVVRGTVYRLADTGNEIDRATFDTALKALRSLQPDAFSADDPTPSRDTVFGLHIDVLTGRRAARRGRDR